MLQHPRIPILVSFGILCALSAYFLFQIKFSFDFEQFFPQGDPDLEFFKEFIEDFEGDDSFMLVAVERKDGVFEQSFLERFHDLSIRAKQLPHVLESQSLTKFSYPVKTPFGVTTLPAIHIDQPEKYERDKARILEDERFVYNLINPDATALTVFLKTEDGVDLDMSETLMTSLDSLVESYDFEAHHYIGRAYFQRELVEMQQREVIKSSLISAVLVMLVMFWLYRRFWGIFIALLSIGVGMLLFFGLLSALGRELSAMAALYPVLMIIVGTSDVVHIMTKYIDELRKGLTKRAAIQVTLREIGLATLLTSTTTAIGFLTLLTSRIGPIRDFGINSAIGVMIAYLTVLTFTTALLSLFEKEQLIKLGRGQAFWDRSMRTTDSWVRRNARAIGLGAAVVTVLTFVGIAQISTNYTIINNLPRGEKITEDFRFFERNFTGFRPFEIAVLAQGDSKVTDYEVMRQTAELEDYLKRFPQLRATTSATAVYKSLHRMYNGNQAAAYTFPPDERTFEKYDRFAKRVPQLSTNLLVSEDGEKARITSRILDFGADSIKVIGREIDAWVAANTDSTQVTFKQTGTGLIIDKNSEYVRRSLLQGLGLAILIVSLLMALLFRNWRMLLISIVPNIFPLLLAGALLGYLGIELEGGTSIVFAVIFGIAVDDTIHFLSKFKLAYGKGLSVDEAIHVTFMETGKAIVLTTILLFFGFLVMLFSVHPPSVTVGLLISLTLFSAVFADLLLIPPLLRWLYKGERKAVVA